MKMIKRCAFSFVLIMILSVFMNMSAGSGYKYSYCKAYAAATAQNTQTNPNEEAGKKSDEIEVKDAGKGVEKEINSLYDYINNMKSNVEIMQNLNPVEYVETYIKEGHGNVSWKTLSKGIISLLFREVRTVIKLCLSIIVISLLCSVLKKLQESFSNDSISEVAFYACYAVVIMILSKSFIISVGVAKDVINAVSDFMSALLPVLVTMIGLTGGVTQAASLDPVILFCVIFIPKLYSDVIIPLILMEFVLEFVNNLSKEDKISNLCDLFKQCILWLQGIIITVFIGVLTIRGITSSTIDAVTLKTAKYAVDNFVPVVGKAFSDAIVSVAGYSLIIKNAVSSVGLLVIIIIMIYPLIKLILMTFAYKLSSALIEPVADKRITKSLAAAGKSMVLITSCVLTVSLMFFVLIGIIASSGRYVIGG